LDAVTPHQALRTTRLHAADNFLILTFFKLFIKITPHKHYLHLVTPLAAPGGVARQPAFAAVDAKSAPRVEHTASRTS
jgi:hypothetical protein